MAEADPVVESAEAAGRIGRVDRSVGPRIGKTGTALFRSPRPLAFFFLTVPGWFLNEWTQRMSTRAWPRRSRAARGWYPLAEPPAKCRLPAVDHAGYGPKSTWLERARSTNEDQAAVGTTSAGPVLSLESRMPTWLAHFAISTHAPPVSLLYEDLNQADSSATSRTVILVMMAMSTLVLVLPGTRLCGLGAERCRAWRRSGGCAFEPPAARR